MPGRLKLTLTETQRAELEEIREHARQPYLRERAAALLKIAQGFSGREVARKRLNQAHWQDTIYEWVKRYLQEGKSGLIMRKGRGRKPAFFPKIPR